MTAKPIRIEIYSKPDCHLCVKMKEEVLKAKEDFNLEIREINIEEDREFYEKYKYEIPVIHINGRKAFKYRLDPLVFSERLKKEL